MPGAAHTCGRAPPFTSLPGHQNSNPLLLRLCGGICALGWTHIKGEIFPKRVEDFSSKGEEGLNNDHLLDANCFVFLVPDKPRNNMTGRSNSPSFSR